MTLTTFTPGQWIMQINGSVIKFDNDMNINLNGCFPLVTELGEELDNVLEYKLERDLERLRKSMGKTEPVKTIMNAEDPNIVLHVADIDGLDKMAESYQVLQYLDEPLDKFKARLCTTIKEKHEIEGTVTIIIERLNKND